MFVTVKLLKKLKACEDQRTLFDRLFPHGVELTRELIVQHAQDFDWRWCACNLANDAGFAAYLRAEEQTQNAYDQAIAPALAAYNQVIAQAWAAHLPALWPAHATVDQAWAAYWEAKKSALDVYQQTDRPARAAYNLARANAFADIMGL